MVRFHPRPLNDTVMVDNNAVIDAGIKKMEAIVYEHFISILRDFCRDLFQSADREYFAPSGKLVHKMTGNLFTSYSCGIYRDGELIELLHSADMKSPPLRYKLVKGEIFPAGEMRYDGTEQKKKFSAPVDTDGRFGQETSIMFLRNYTPATKRGYEVVMCTGAEYSTFIEQERNLNVLTNTFLEAKALFYRNLKPIK